MIQIKIRGKKTFIPEFNEFKIREKKTFIPKFNELTVKKYREVFMYITEKNELSAIKYIAITTGMDERELMHSRIQGLNLLKKQLGEFIYCSPTAAENIKGTFESMKGSKILKFKDKWYDFNKMKMREAGYRVLYEQYMQKAKSVMDIYTFFVAAAIDSNFDYENIKEIQQELEKYNAYKVFSIGAFFFKKWRRGTVKGYNFSRMLTKIISISTKTKKQGQALID